MPTYVPPKINTPEEFYVSLVSQADTKVLQSNPTLAVGDVKVAVDGAAPADIATLPVVDAAFPKRVKVSLSAAEKNGANVSIIFADAAGAEWCDLLVNLQTAARQVDDLATQASVDAVAASVATRATQVSVDAKASQASVDALATNIAALTAKVDALATQETATQASIANLQARTPAALVGGRTDANLGAINNQTAGVSGLSRSARTIVEGTVGAGSVVTSIVTSSLDPSPTAADQFKGRIVLFAKDTVTLSLRGQTTDITASTATGVLSVTALTTAPASGDTFVIV